MAQYTLLAGGYSASTIQAAVGSKYHVGFSNGTNYYGYMLVPDASQSGGWHERTDITAKDQLTQYSSPNIIDRDFTFWPRVSQGDWSGGFAQSVFVDNTRSYDAELETGIPGALQLKPQQQEIDFTSSISGAGQARGVAINTSVWWTAGKGSAGEMYSLNTNSTSIVSHAAGLGPGDAIVEVGTDGNYFYYGNGSNLIKRIDPNGLGVTTVSTVTHASPFWIVFLGTSGFRLYYSNGAGGNNLFFLDLTQTLPVNTGVAVPTGGIGMNIIDVCAWQNGIAILSMNVLSDYSDVWFHDGSNMTLIAHLDGVQAKGMCAAQGQLFVSALAVSPTVMNVAPVLYLIMPGSIQVAVRLASPTGLAANVPNCGQPRSSGGAIYWPVFAPPVNLNSGGSTHGYVVRYDLATASVTHLPDLDWKAAWGVAALDAIIPVGESVYVPANADTGTTVRIHFLSNCQIGRTATTALFQTSGNLVTSRFDFQTPGIVKRFRRLECVHAALPTNCTIKVDAFIDKDPAAWTSGLTPDATVTNSTVGATTTNLNMNQLLGKSAYFVFTLTSSDGLNTPVINWYSIEITTPWAWELTLDCTNRRRLLDGEEDKQGINGKDLYYLFRNAWETPVTLTLYHRNGSSYTVAVESLEAWNPSPQKLADIANDEEYIVKVTLRQVA